MEKITKLTQATSLFHRKNGNNIEMKWKIAGYEQINRVI
tara:strand:- start:323 stop:439 length:117 start_codon:yes stop_codon:yes gene_type:complete